MEVVAKSKKALNHEGHEGHKGKEKLFFVLFVSFVVPFFSEPFATTSMEDIAKSIKALNQTKEILMTPITNTPVNEQSQHGQPRSTGTHDNREVSSAEQSWPSFLRKQIGTVFHWLTQWSSTQLTSTDAARTSITNRRTKQVTQSRVRYYDALTPEQWYDEYGQVTLPGNSDQMMQWVIFNDRTNSERVATTSPPLGKNELAQLKAILQNLKKHYPVNTPTVHLVYEIFQPKLLKEDQITKVHEFFQQLEKDHENLKVVDYQGIKHQLFFGKDLSRAKEKIIESQSKGLFPRINISYELDKVLGRNIIDFHIFYGKDKQTIWQNMVKKHPWLNSFNGEDIVSVYDSHETGRQQMLTIFKRQLDNMPLAELESFASKDKHKFPPSLKGAYIDLHRSVLLYNPEVTCNCEQKHSLIHRDFDTTMSGPMPDIKLSPRNILGLVTCLPYNPAMCDQVCFITENNVMGVAERKNTNLKAVLDKSLPELVDAVDPCSLEKKGVVISNYNYVYDQLADVMVRRYELPFSHSAVDTLRVEVI